MGTVKAYACYSKNEQLRIHSSSGAIFSCLASQILSAGGIVYGVAMSEDCYRAEFISVTDEEGLKKLRGSKYLQANAGDTFRKVKADLAEGKTVLFSGTGCQVNGLKSFLGKNYDNLICVDVICHGAPSPELWKKYAQYQEQQNGGKLKSINFRCKDAGWTDFGMKEVIGGDIPEKRLYISKNEDPYMQMFLRNYSLRPSCYACTAKDVKLSDLTIGDFWGIKEVAPEMNDHKGTSLVLVRTEKGKHLFEVIQENLKTKEVTYEDGVRSNPAEYRSPVRPEQRDPFFPDMRRMDFEALAKKYAASPSYPLKSRVKRKIKNMVKLVTEKLQRRVTCHSNTEYGLLFVFDSQEKQ